MTEKNFQPLDVSFHAALVKRIHDLGIDPDAYAIEMETFENSDEGLPYDGRADVLFFHELFVASPRQQGIGGIVLREALKLADELKTPIVLNPWAQGYGPDTLPQPDLENWYQRLGFVWDENVEDHLMTRLPGTPIPAPMMRSPAP